MACKNGFTDLVVISRPPLPLPWYTRLHLLPQYGLMLRDIAYIRQSLLHHHRHRIRCLLRVCSFPDRIQRNTIPPICLLQSKVPLQLEVKRMILPGLSEFSFLRNLPRYVELAGLGVEVDGSDADEEVDVDSLRGGRARDRFGCHAADGRGAEEIRRAN